MVKIDKIIVLDMKVYTYGELEYIHPIILIDGEDLILVDSGYPKYGKRIEELLIEKGLDPKKLKKVVLTHHDHDHIGGTKEILSKYPEVEVLSSKIESEYISGEKKSLRLIQSERNLELLDETQKKYALEYIETLLEVENVKVDRILENGEHIDNNKKWKVIFTPGHTPGHISLYNEEDKILIAGNALVLENGHIEIGNQGYCLDIKEAWNTKSSLLNMDIEKIYCYHGGLYEKNKR